MNFVKTSEIVEKKSKFFGYLLKASSLEEVNAALAFLRAEHKKCTHICYAYSLSSPFAEKAVDDGEPGGTAGKPILNVIHKKGLSNVCIFVVRYFGGIKLGAGGLVRAYTKTCSALFEVKG